MTWLGGNTSRENGIEKSTGCWKERERKWGGVAVEKKRLRRLKHETDLKWDWQSERILEKEDGAEKRAKGKPEHAAVYKQKRIHKRWKNWDFKMEKETKNK